MAYWKKIKNTNAVPVLKDELVFDQTPTVNSTNPVTSDGVARAIAGASGEVPVVTESDNGKILTAIYDEGGAAVEWADAPQELPSTLGTAGQVLKVNAGGTGVEWGAAGATYTAGDGIDINAQNAVSVKAGNGLEIGDVTSTGETVSLTTSAYYNVDDSWCARDICPLTDSLLESIASGLTLKLIHGTFVAFYPNATAYACLYSYASETSSSVTIDKRLVLGSAITLNQGFIFDGSEVDFDGRSVNAGLSNTTMSDLIADMSSNTYHVGILIKSNDNYLAAAHQVSTSPQRPSGPTTMATYTETTTIHDALNVANPLPASAIGDAGKVLTVNNAGSAEWATPSGGGDDVVVLTYGASVSYNDIYYAITQENKRFAVQGTVAIDGYNYTVYSDEMGFFGAGNMVAWLVTIPGQANTYQLKLAANSNWYADKYAGLPSTSGASAGQVLSLNNYSQPVWTTPAASGGMKWSRNTHPTVDASNGITATLSGLSVTNSACVVNVSLLIYPSDMFTTNIPSTLTFKVLMNLEFSDWYVGTLTAELASYQHAGMYRACGTVTLPYGSSELSQIVIYDPNGTSLVVSGASYEVSVGVAK